MVNLPPLSLSERRGLCVYTCTNGITQLLRVLSDKTAGRTGG